MVYTAARLYHHVINEAINEWRTQQRTCIIMLSTRRSTSGVHSIAPVSSCYQRGDQRVAYTAAHLCHHVINDAINEWRTQQRACIIMLSMRRSTSGVHSSTPVSQLMGDTWNVFSEQAEWINCFLLLGHLPILLFDFVDTLCLALNLLLALQGTVATCQV